MAQANHFVRPIWACAVAAAGMAAPADSVAYATGGRDCRAVNQGYLTTQLAPTTSTVRNVSLTKGDIVTFAIASGAGGSVTFPSGTRLLLAGTRGTRKSFTAARSGNFAFRFAAEGVSVVSFTASCASSAVRAARIEADMSDIGTLLEEDAAPMIDPEPSGSAPRTPASLDEAAAPRSAKEEAGAGDGLTPASPKPDTQAEPSKAGVKVKLHPAIMVGVLAQFNQGEGSLLAGPVTSLQLGAGTSLEARAAWGAVEADPAARSHAADRRLVDARLTNKQAFGAWRFSPSVGLNYAQDRSEAAPGEPNASGLRTSETGRVDVRPEVAYRFDMDHAMYIEPKVMVGPFWDLGDRYAPGPGSPAHSEARLKAETGITFGTTHGTKLQIGGGVEEGGPNSLNVWSGRLRVDVPLK